MRLPDVDAATARIVFRLETITFYSGLVNINVNVGLITGRAFSAQVMEISSRFASAVIVGRRE